METDSLLRTCREPSYDRGPAFLRDLSLQHLLLRPRTPTIRHFPFFLQ
jgi:hypothetical protein